MSLPKKGTDKYDAWKKSDEYKIWYKKNLETHPKQRIHKICSECGKPFDVKPSNSDLKRCSSECRGKAQSKRQTGSNNPCWKPKIHKFCVICGEPFDLTPSLKDRECCSMECGYKLLSKRMKGKPKTQEQKDKQSEFMIGRYVGEKNPMWNKHHSTKTKDKISKALSGEKHPWYGKKNPVHAEKMRGKGNPNYIHGRSNEPYTLEFNKELKAIIRHRDGYKCQKCGMPEIESNRRLDIHHIDYCKDNCIPSNLISLCFKCNITVNYNRPYWMEYFAKRIKEIMESPLQLHLNYEISNKEIIRSP